jgi:ABC-type nitrate/sulfonate/bicarbonate transport system permease component
MSNAVTGASTPGSTAAGAAEVVSTTERRGDVGATARSRAVLVIKPKPRGWRRLANRLRLRHNRAWLTFLLFLLVWHIAAEYFVSKPIFLVGPWQTGEAFADLIESGTLWSDVKISASEFFKGFVAGLVVGIALGMALGTSNRVKDYVDPLINGLYATPLIALAPLFILWFGIGQTKTVVLVFLLCVLPIAINTDVGIRATDPQLIETAKSFGAKKYQLFTMVRLPTSISFVVAGIRMGIARGLIGVVVGEFFGSQSGVGYRILISSQYFDNATLLACVLVFALSGVALVKVFERFERRIAPWKFLK